MTYDYKLVLTIKEKDETGPAVFSSLSTDILGTINQVKVTPIIDPRYIGGEFIIGLDDNVIFPGKYIVIPSGETSERPDMPLDGTFRHNTSLLQLEYYSSNEWWTLATESYVVNTIFSSPINLIGDVSGSGTINNPIEITINKTLNQMVNSGNIDVNNYYIQNLLTPINPQDAATKAYVDSRVAPGGIASLTGFVEGVNPDLGVLTTTRGPTCLLTNIPAGGNVDMDGFSVKNMQEMPNDGLDATSATFLIKLLSDEVCILWP